MDSKIADSMNYIGSKYRLSDFIKKAVYSVAGHDLSGKVFCDLFAGTGIVGRSFKEEVKQVISNDLEYYSYVLNQNYIGNHQPFEYRHYLEMLNQLEGCAGFIFEEYSENGRAGRLYFSEANGQKADAVRRQIETWHREAAITGPEYYFLLASLLESADKIANTASVYGAYLKHLKKSAQKPLTIAPALFAPTKQEHRVFNEDSNELIKSIEGDILYLDPPYNARQYGANYHLLNTIARYDRFTPAGKTGLRPYKRSEYCSRQTVLQSFEALIQQAAFRYIFISYNNEGLLSETHLRQLLSRYGRYDLFTTRYNRFRADKTVNRQHKADATTEYLFVLEKT